MGIFIGSIGGAMAAIIIIHSLMVAVMFYTPAYACTKGRSFPKRYWWSQWVDRIEHRYILETQWDHYIRRKDLLLLVWYWIIILVVVDFPYAVGFIIFPLLVLEGRRIKVHRSIDRALPLFLHMLSARLAVQQDMVSALKYCASRINSPYLRRIIMTLDYSLRATGDAGEAFHRTGEMVYHEYLQYVLINLEQLVNHWGCAPDLVQSLEQEYLSIQMEDNRKKVALQNDRIIALFSMILVCLTSWQMVRRHAFIHQYFESHPVTKIVLLLMTGWGGRWLLKKED